MTYEALKEYVQKHGGRLLNGCLFYSTKENAVYSITSFRTEEPCSVSGEQCAGGYGFAEVNRDTCEGFEFPETAFKKVDPHAYCLFMLLDRDFQKMRSKFNF